MTQNDPTETWMDLADAVTLLRDQIAEAQDRLASGGHKGVMFGLGEINLELGLELGRTRGVNGNLRFGVVGVGAKGDRTSKTTHKVTIQLNPRSPEGGPVDVNDWD